MIYSNGQLVSRPPSTEIPLFRQHPSQRPSIAVIDGDARMQRYLQRILESHARDIVAFDFAGEAVEHIRKGKQPDILIASSSLPDLSSLELLAILRKLECRSKVALMAHV